MHLEKQQPYSQQGKLLVNKTKKKKILYDGPTAIIHQCLEYICLQGVVKQIHLLGEGHIFENW